MNGLQYILSFANLKHFYIFMTSNFLTTGDQITWIFSQKGRNVCYQTEQQVTQEQGSRLPSQTGFVNINNSC